MTKLHSENERIKRRYLLFLKDAKGRDEDSIDAAAAAIARFENYTRHRDFKAFHFEQARAFKAHLSGERNARTGKPLSASTIHSTLSALKAFFVWLADQPRYASKVKYSDAEYFSTPENLARTATAHRAKDGPTLAQVRAMIDALPDGNEIAKRDRALVAFAILTGARDSAIVSFRLKHVDVERERVEQDAREVRTKRAKTFTTTFFPIGDDIRQIVVDWIAYLRDAKGFGPDDPLFPKTKMTLDENGEFRAVALDREPWANANRVREVFQEACARAGLRYFNPHSFRNALVQVAYDRKLDALAFKAWSQNLGHDSCLTTFSSYGTIPPHRQAEIIRRLGEPTVPADVRAGTEMLRRILDQMEQGGTIA